MNISCPKCGARFAPSTEKCIYCGTRIQLTETSTAFSLQKNSMEAETAVESRVQLPPELINLPRGHPEPPISKLNARLILGFFLTLFSIVIVILAIKDLAYEQDKYQRLTEEGHVTIGVVTKLEVIVDDVTFYDVNYHFTAQSNGGTQDFDRCSSVSRSLYRDLSVGQQVEIIYAASDPRISELKANFGKPDVFSEIFAIVMSLLFAIFGVVIMISGLRITLIAGKLKKSGCVTYGLYFDCWQKEDSDGNKSYIIAYAFHVDTQKGPHWVTRYEYNPSAYKKHKIGDALKVRYLTSNPAICQIIDNRG